MLDTERLNTLVPIRPITEAIPLQTPTVSTRIPRQTTYAVMMGPNVSVLTYLQKIVHDDINMMSTYNVMDNISF